MKSLVSILTTTIVWIFLSTEVRMAYSFLQSDNRIWDLESLDETGFALEAMSWSVSQLTVPGGPKYSFCYDKYLLGGYYILPANAFFTRTYTSLPIHNMFHFVFHFQAIDSWDGLTQSDYADITFDSITTFSTWRLDFTGYPTDLCGTPAGERPGITTIMEVPHSATTSLTVQIKSKLNSNSDDESFGFRDIEITFYNSTDPTLTSSFCGIASFTLPNRPCACPSAQHYQNPTNSGNCYPCDSTCATCSGSSSSSCLTCPTGRYFQGNQCKPCHSSCLNCAGATANDCIACPMGDFLINNNTCIHTCPYPMVYSSSGVIEFCSYPPCASSSPYILWDQTCSGSCPTPLLTQQTFLATTFCLYNCLASEYLYWNGTCGSSCDFPLTVLYSHGRHFCQYSCSSGILFWDGTCLTALACTSPAGAVVEGGKSFCRKPCPDFQYLYWNGSCLPTCNFPLSITTSGIAPVCTFPCSSTQILYWDGTCGASTSCGSPLVSKTEGTGSNARTFCTFPCSIDQFLYWNGTCASTCIPPLQYSYTNTRSFCNFPCSSPNYILNWDGTCISSCLTPLKTRLEATKTYCDFPCVDPDYLYWNQTCISQCNSPLIPKIQGPAKFCNYPCSSANFLYWNGQCLSTCPLPQQKLEGTSPNIKKFCLTPCNNVSEYYNWYGSCTASCDPPLVTRIQNRLKYCDYPCISSSDSLYWNGSCISSCDSPLVFRIANGAQFCDFPCPSPNHYLNWNGTCSLGCSGSSILSVEGIGSGLRRFCRYGCQSNEYLYWNESCLTTCKPPFKVVMQGNYRLCQSPCERPSDFYYEDSKTCQSECNVPYSIDNNETSYNKCVYHEEDNGWLVKHILTSSAEPGEVTFITLVRMMQYVRYLDINMPPRLQRLAMSKSRNLFSLRIGYFMPNQSDFTSSNLPAVFEKHMIPSDFLVSFFEDMTTFGIFILLAIIFTALENICKIYNWKPWCFIFERLRGITKWNMLLVAIFSNIDDIVLYSSFQFRTFSFSSSSTFTIISFFSCLFTNGVMISLMVFTVILAQGAQKSKDTSFGNIETNKYMTKWRDFQVLIQGYSDTSLFKQLFYLVYVVRVGLSTLIASYLISWPFPQICLQLAINALILLYIICSKPIRKKVNHIQLMITEGLALIMNACMFMLTYRDSKSLGLSTLYIVLGDMVIVGNLLTNVVFVVFLVIKILIEAKNIYKGLKAPSAEERAAWIQLLVVPIQQGGMGFEEIVWIPDSENTFTGGFDKIEDKSTLLRIEGHANKITDSYMFTQGKEHNQVDAPSYDVKENQFENDIAPREKFNSIYDMTPGFVADKAPHEALPNLDLDAPSLEPRTLDHGRFEQDNSSIGMREYYRDNHERRKK